ncbi:MAG TPA: hypothetical protein VFC31_08495 [Candidatus Limnocylindria bacterium]|nr:hypothetical protein [Candidatus Limnocylindria bacterium]
MDIAALISTVTGWIASAWPLIGPALGALAGFWLAAYFEERRDTRRDRRLVRDGKLARMRAALQPLLLGSWSMQSVSVGMVFGYGGETDDAKNKRLTAMLQEGSKGVNEARAQLALETDSQQFVDQYQKVFVAFNQYALAFNDAKAGDTTAKPTEKRQALEEAVDTLNEMAKNAIAQIEKSG